MALHRTVLRFAGVAALVAATLGASAARAQVNPVPRLPASKPYPPTPRLADGTPNLGPTEPNKGYWHLTQFQDYLTRIKNFRKKRRHQKRLSD